MISVSNLKIDFKKINSKQNLKKNEVNVLFLDNFKEIKFKPIWLSNEIEKFLIKNSKARKIKEPYLFETEFGLFLMIPIFFKLFSFKILTLTPNFFNFLHSSAKDLGFSIFAGFQTKSLVK